MPFPHHEPIVGVTAFSTYFCASVMLPMMPVNMLLKSCAIPPARMLIDSSFVTLFNSSAPVYARYVPVDTAITAKTTGLIKKWHAVGFQNDQPAVFTHVCVFHLIKGFCDFINFWNCLARAARFFPA